MSRLLLDTTFLVEADRSEASLDEVIAEDDDVAIAAVTVAELSVGLLLADEGPRDARRRFLEGVRQAIPVVDYDVGVASAHAELLVEVRRQGRPRGAHDLIIAATAKATQREVVSADLTAYRDLPGVTIRSLRS